MKPCPATRSEVRAIVRRRRDVLILRAASGAGGWELPGGPLHIGEAPLVGLMRHSRSRLGIDLDVVGGGVRLQHSDGFRQHERHYFHCTTGDDPEPIGEYAEARWVSLAHLREYFFADPTQAFIDQLVESRFLA